MQEYISGKYSALITEGGDEDAKAQIKRYITKYVQDRRIAVKGYSGDQLVDALYTEMAEFGLLTKYIFGTGIEEINVNSWRDIELLYANGETVKLEEHFDSPEHAVNVIRRMLHVSGMVLDNASPAVLGHLSKNIRIAVLKTPLVDEDVGVTASIRIVNPQNMQKEDFVKGGTATGPMLDFLAACLSYGVSVCVAGATGSGKSTLITHMNGLNKPTSGHIIIDGRDLWAEPEKIREFRFLTGLVFQYPEYQLFEETCYKDIAFGPRNMGLDEAEIDRRVHEAADFVGLDEALLQRSPFELSGGQKRRVAVAGVMAMKPRILVLDEPAAGLDPEGRDEILSRN